MIKLKDIIKEIGIEEGVNDPSILKAVFLAGGPGSGKSTVAKHLFGMPTSGGTTGGLKNVNSDRFFEFMLQKTGVSTDLASLPPDEFERATVGPQSQRGIAKNLLNTAEKHYLAGRLGLLIDGTADKTEKLIAYKDNLETNFGYDTYMVFVNTPLEVALQRNSKRERKLPEDIVTASWKNAQRAKDIYKQLFGSNFIEVINDKSTPDGKPDINPQADKAVQRFASQPVKNPVGLKWIEDAKAAAKLTEQDRNMGWHPEMPPVKIFCDMDGVLADFVKQWKKYYGADPNIQIQSIGKPEFDKILDNAPHDFWAKMDWMPNSKGGKALWDKIKKYDTEILSAPAESDASRIGKADWLKSKGISAKLNLEKARDKRKFAAANHILIDDYKRNIDQWVESGGIGIWHRDNVTTFAELRKYGII
jgi:predicted kinase